MAKRITIKISSLLMIFVILIGIIPVNNVSAAGEFYYVNNSKVNAHTGTVLVDTRLSDHGTMVHKVGDKIEGTTYYQISPNGQMTGKPFICIEVGTQFSSYKTYGENASKYVMHGEYNNKKLEAFIAYMNYKGMNNLPTLMQMAVWSILGQVKLDQGQATDLLDDFEKEYSKNPDSNIFKGATLYEYRDTKYDGQRLISYEYEKKDEYDFELLKVSKNKELTDIAKSSYKLDGAKYGVYKSKDNALKDIDSLGILTTDISGKTNKITLESGIYYIKEISAPKGFKLDKTIYTADLTKGNATFKVKDSPKFDPLNIMLQKEDSTGKKLQGAEFRVNYYDGIHNDVSNLKPVRSWIFVTNENGYFDFHNDFKIGGDELFFDESGIPVGLIGTYEFTEIKAPNGYKLNNKSYLAYVKDDGNLAYVGNSGTIYNSPKVLNSTQKIIINKIDSSSKENIKDLTSFMLLINGKDISTKLVGENGKYIYKEDATNKTEITTDTNGKLEINGLPNGIYEILERKAPKGYLISDVKHTFVMANKDASIDIQNTKIPSIATKFAKVNSDNKIIDPLGEIDLEDIVEYKNLIEGEEYKLKLVLMDKKTNEPLKENEQILQSEIKFIPKSKNGKISVPIKINSSVFKGREIVAFEDLYYKDKIVTSHKDINDSNQTLKITDPSLKTTATDNISGNKIHIPTEMVSIRDRISYSDLIVGNEYTIKGKLMDKTTKQAVKNINGEEIKNEISFVADKSDGYIDMLFNVEGSLIRGKETVVFEDLYVDEKLLVSHSDINDDSQTTRTINPKIETTFFETKTKSKELLPNGSVDLVDVVNFSDLEINQEYKLILTIMNKFTKKALLDNDGKIIQASIKFIPKTQSGSIEVPIKIDISNLENQEIVAFERLYFNDDILASHEDINDENQTIVIKSKPIPKPIPKQTPRPITKYIPIEHQVNNPNTGDTGILGFVSLILISIFTIFFIRKSKIS